MELNELSTATGATKKRKRVGRGPGSGNGKTAGRGHKGQQARSGYSRHYGFEGGQMPLFRRIPKRGFTNAQFRIEYDIVNVSALEQYFDAGSDVTKQALLERGLIRSIKKRVKILGDGEISKKLNVEADKFSKSAREKISAAGGAVNEVKASA